MLAASALLALIIGAAFTVLLIAISDLRQSEKRTRQSQNVLVATNQLELLLLDLETGQRGFILTRQARFLAPWQAARIEFPKLARALQKLDSGDPEQGLEQRIAARGNAYILDYSVPLVRAARRGDPSARSVAEAVEGRQRVDALRADFARLLSTEREDAEKAVTTAETSANFAQAAAAAAFGGSMLLIFIYAGYLLGAILRPIRRAAGMADRLAGGNLATRMEETGRGEIGTLERSFNVMANSLERDRDELAASRARIVDTADETRRRIERDLHDGAQQRLVSLALELRALQAALPPELGEVSADLSRLAEGLAGVIEELREFARGIHPAILAEGGLEAALKTLARRSPVPVELDVRVAARLPDRIEVAAYYVVSELLTNVAKHAQASVVHVDVRAVDGVLRVSGRDDGIGGADPTRGSGLVGLKDRVEALGGTISVQSVSGEGTIVDVELPLDDTS
jgi:signal transduction histidine kinase